MCGSLLGGGVVPRGDESVKRQLEADIAVILDARWAVREMQEWSIDLARRRWRASDGETFQAYLHRVDAGLGVVHRWMVQLRRMVGVRVVHSTTQQQTQEPPKENSVSTG